MWACTGVRPRTRLCCARSAWAGSATRSFSVSSNASGREIPKRLDLHLILDNYQTHVLGERQSTQRLVPEGEDGLVLVKGGGYSASALRDFEGQEHEADEVGTLLNRSRG